MSAMNVKSQAQNEMGQKPKQLIIILVWISHGLVNSKNIQFT